MRQKLRFLAVVTNVAKIWSIRFCLLVTLLSGTFGLSVGQQKYQLQLNCKDKEEAFLQRHLDLPDQAMDSLFMLKKLQKLLLQLHGAAYLEASIDSMQWRGSLLTAWLFVGVQYQWAELDVGGVEEAFLSQVGYRDHAYQDRPVHYTELRKLQERLLQYAENHGYPFASVGLKNLKIEAQRLTAELYLRKNRLILIEGVNIIGEAKISKRYLESYLGLREGQLFSLQKVRSIRNRIKELPFVKETRDVSVTFKGDEATINLFLDKKKNSRWDFLIGILPNTDAGSRKINLSGSFTGDLQNQFGKGEQLFVDFQRLRPGIQELELRVAYPYVFNLPFGADFSFEQYRRDTIYRDLHADVGIQYLFEGGNFLRAFWKNSSTALLNIDEAQIKSSRQLPNILDISNASFGLEYKLQRLDFRFNPRRGWGLLLKGGAGIKKIKENSHILALKLETDPGFNFGSLYDSLNLRSFQYRLEAGVEAYLPFSAIGQNTLKASVRSGIILNNEPLYQNEQYRLGGNRLLRGFDEESVFASRYAVFTLEGRILFPSRSYSYLYLFTDMGYIEDVTAIRKRYDLPIGVGLGITFETGAGVFAVSLATGRTRQSPFDFGNPKVHLGYVSYF